MPPVLTRDPATGLVAGTRRQRTRAVARHHCRHQRPHQTISIITAPITVITAVIFADIIAISVVVLFRVRLVVVVVPSNFPRRRMARLEGDRPLRTAVRWVFRDDEDEGRVDEACYHGRTRLAGRGARNITTQWHVIVQKEEGAGRRELGSQPRDKT